MDKRVSMFVRSLPEDNTVASLMQNLIEVLNMEHSEYIILLELSKKKTPIIVKGDLDKLTQITDEEQIVVNRINHLEEQRTTVMDDIANVINKDVETLKLDNVIKMLKGQPTEQKMLSEIHDKLHDTISNLNKVNENNRELIQTAMEMVDFEMGMVQALRTAPETANYNRGATNSGYTMGTAPSGFDAKQ